MMAKIALPLIVVLLIFFFFWGRAYPTIEVNGVRINDPAEVVSLTSSTDEITSGNYDTFESPRGSDFQVPAGRTLYLTHITGNPVDGAGSERVTLGYSTDTVDNGSIPTGAVVVFNMTYEETNTATIEFGVWGAIPEGMFPFFGVEGAGAVQATGFLR